MSPRGSHPAILWQPVLATPDITGNSRNSSFFKHRRGPLATSLVGAQKIALVAIFCSVPEWTSALTVQPKRSKKPYKNRLGSNRASGQAHLSTVHCPHRISSFFEHRWSPLVTILGNPVARKRFTCASICEAFGNHARRGRPLLRRRRGGSQPQRVCFQQPIQQRKHAKNIYTSGKQTPNLTANLTA